jgi:hypothetical protein
LESISFAPSAKFDAWFSHMLNYVSLLHNHEPALPSTFGYNIGKYFNDVVDCRAYIFDVVPSILAI